MVKLTSKSSLHIRNRHTDVSSMHTRAHGHAHKQKSKADVYTVTPTQTGWDTCALSRHSESVQANPPGDGTGALQGGCACLMDDGA